MERIGERAWANAQNWVEAFAILNLSFLTFDIYLAHSMNQFRNRAEYIPLIFSATAPALLIAGSPCGRSWVISWDRWRCWSG